MTFFSNTWVTGASSHLGILRGPAQKRLYYDFQGTSYAQITTPVTFVGDFYIEFDARLDATGAFHVILGNTANSDSFITTDASDNLMVKLAGILYPATSLKLTSAFQHVRMERDGVNFFVVVAGDSENFVANASSVTFDEVGGFLGAQGRFDGVIANLDLNSQHLYSIDDDSFTLVDSVGGNDAAISGPGVWEELPEFIPFSMRLISHALWYGQSLSEGIKGLPILPTISNGSGTFWEGPRKFPDVGIAIKPLNENDGLAPDGNSTAGQTSCSGYAQKFGKCFASTGGNGGTAIADLVPSSSWYISNVGPQIAGAASFATAPSNYSLPVMCWVQGEQDIVNNTETLATYTAKLLSIKTDLDSLALTASGNASDLTILTYVTCWHSRLNDLMARIQSDMYFAGDTVIATPVYHLPYDADKTHLTNTGYDLMGAYFGLAAKKINSGGRWKPTAPVEIAISGAVITIDMEHEGANLLIDTAEPILNQGFKVTDLSDVDLPIDSVVIVGSSQIIVTLSSDPAAEVRIRYGIDYASVALNAKVDQGGGGQIRDDSTETAISDGVTHPLYNWGIPYAVQTPFNIGGEFTEEFTSEFT